jgi:hypothetical protein
VAVAVVVARLAIRTLIAKVATVLHQALLVLLSLAPVEVVVVVVPVRLGLLREVLVAVELVVPHMPIMELVVP